MAINLNFTVTGNRSLTPQEAEYLKLLANLYPDGALREVFLLDNHQPHSDGNGIKGAVYVFSPHAKLRAAAPLTKRLFGHSMTARLDLDDGQVLDEAAARQKLHKEFPAAVPVKSNAPYLLSQQRSSDEVDSSEWQESLGEHGSYVELCREEVRGMAPIYHLAINCQADQISEDLIALLSRRDGNITIQELLQSAEYARVRIASERNAKRVLAKAAAVIGARILTQDDAFAFVDDSKFDAPPTLGIPDVHTPYNYLEERHVNGHKAVVYYSHATGLSDNRHAVIQMINPNIGVRLYLGDPKRDLTNNGPFSNEAANAFPVNVGRVTDQATLKQRRRVLENVSQARSFANQTFCWYGKEAGSSPASNDRTFVYGDLSTDVAANLAENLGARYGYIELRPVAALLPSIRATA